MKTRTISVYLLRRAVSKAADALGETTADLSEYEVPAAGTEARLFVSVTDARSPDWATLFAGETTEPLELKRPSFGAVLVLKSAGRWFALTFGSGRFLLADGIYERDFGLYAALNIVAEDQIRALQSRAMSGGGLLVNRQSPRATEISQLELNSQRDLLTVLEGSIMDGEVGKRISGADAARLTDEFEVRTVRRTCKRLLTASRGTDYKKRFPWVDDIEAIRSDDEVRKIRDVLLDRLLSGDTANLDVYPPEFVGQSVAEFDPGNGSRVMEPTPALLARVVRRIDASTPEQLLAALQTRRIKAIDDNGDVVQHWTWWDCLYLEEQVGDSVTVLHAGRLFRVKRDLASAVNRFVGALPNSGLRLPSCQTDELEGPYNARVAANDLRFTLLDRNLVPAVPGESRVEICDLFSDAGHLVHVKRRKGGSSGLSHLFGQATVSCTLISQQPSFRSAIREKTGGRTSPMKEPLTPGDHEVVLAVMASKQSQSAGASSLPFFSKVFLRQNALILQSMGFSVAYDEIRAE